MTSPTVGDTAPDFTLAGTNGAFHLADHRGQTVVLVFYPGDDTKVCTKQLCEYTDRWDDLSGLDATIVGISGKDLASKEKFTTKRALKVPLLADPDRTQALASRIVPRHTSCVKWPVEGLHPGDEK